MNITREDSEIQKFIVSSIEKHADIELMITSGPHVQALGILRQSRSL